MQVEIYSGSLNRLRTEVLVLACFKDMRPLRGLAGEIDWYYCGIISRMIMQNHFTGLHGETLLIPAEGKLHIPKVVLIGLGPSASYDVTQFENALLNLIEIIKGLQVRGCAIATTLFCGEGLKIPWVAASFLKSWQEDPPSPDLNLVIEDVEEAKALQRRIKSGTVFEID